MGIQGKANQFLQSIHRPPEMILLNLISKTWIKFGICTNQFQMFHLWMKATQRLLFSCTFEYRRSFLDQALHVDVSMTRMRKFPQILYQHYDPGQIILGIQTVRKVSTLMHSRQLHRRCRPSVPVSPPLTVGTDQRLVTCLTPERIQSPHHYQLIHRLYPHHNRHLRICQENIQQLKEMSDLIINHP